MPKLRILMGLAGCALAAGAPGAALAEPAADRLEAAFFGGRSSMSADLSRVPQWSALIARERKAPPVATSGKSSPGKAAGAAPVRRASAEAGLSILAALTAVNAELNANPYRTDNANWRQTDYWATSNELSEYGGDCEDFAAAKYFALRELGVSADDLRIAIVVDDEIAERHAILLVRIGAEIFALDNRRDRLTRSAELAHYRPLIAMNEDAWWLADDDMRAAPEPALMAASQASPIG